MRKMRNILIPATPGIARERVRRFRPIQIFMAACGAAALMATTGGTAWAAGSVCSVGHAPAAEFKTIDAAVQEAENTPGACKTINVAAGKYEEKVVVATEGVTLNGAQAGVDARTRGGGADNEATQSIISSTGLNGDVEPEAANVTIDGFTLEGSGSATEPIGVLSDLPVSGTKVLYNVIQNNMIGLDVNNATAHQAQVKYNLIRKTDIPGPAGGNGMYVENMSNILLEDNEFTENVSGGMIIIGSAAGGGVDEDITIANNDFGAEQGMFLTGAKEVTIEGNVATAGANLDVAGADSKVQINKNVLRNGEMAIVDGNYYDPYKSPSAEHVGPNSEITATDNCIEGNSLAGIGMGSFVGSGPYYEELPFTFDPEPGSAAPFNAATGPLSAQNNWWGSPTGPTIASNPGGTGDRLIDGSAVVTYTPYLTSPPAHCPAAPSAHTEGASAVTQTSATLHGSVNPHGQNVSNWKMEYGVGGYTNSAPCEGQTGAVEVPVGCTAPVTGLEAGTEYDYRIVATDSLGTSYGQNETFKTPPAGAPAITAVSPHTGPESGGTTVTISGVGLAHATAVKFGSAGATVTADTATSITATSPAGTGTVNVTVTTREGTSATNAADEFTYASTAMKPTVTMVLPKKGSKAGGTSVTVTGSGFIAGATVRFGLVTATEVKVDSESQITVVSPAAAKKGTVNVTVTTAGGTSVTSKKDRFKYTK